MANVNGSAGEDWALVHSSSFNGIVRLTAGFPKGIGYVGTVAPTPTTPGFSIDRDGEQLTIPFGEAFYLRAYKGNVSVTLVPVGGAGTGGGYQVYEKTTNNQPAVFTSTANRDAYFTAQASELDSINNSGFAIGIGTVAEDPQQSNISQWQARIEGVWVDVVTTLVGATGAPGASGNSYFFSSDANRDTFFSVPANRALLEHDLPITVNNGGDAEISYWSGLTGPASYDSNLWRASSLMVPAGSVTLGGVRISEGGNALVLTNESTGARYLAQGGQFDDTGSFPTNNLPVVAALVANPPQTVDTDTFSGNRLTLGIAAPSDFLLKDFGLRFNGATQEVTVSVHPGTDDTLTAIATINFNALDGDNTLLYDSNPRFVSGSNYFIVYETTSPALNILGDNSGAVFVPYFTSNVWPYLEVTGASSASSVTLFTDVTDAGSGEIITTAERATVTAITDTGSGAIITTTERATVTAITDTGSGSIITAAERTAIEALNDMDKILYTVDQASSLPSNAVDGVFAIVSIGITSSPKGIYEKSPAGWNIRLDVSTTTISVIDNLASSSTTDALSANQGRSLKLSLDNNSNFKQFVTLRANLVAGSELDYAMVSPGTNSEPPGIYQYLSSIWALVLDMSTIVDSNVQSDWNQTDAAADDYIENKPTTITQAETDKLALITSTGSGAIISANERAIINSVRLDDIAVFQSHTFVVGNVVYNDGSNWVLAQANTAATAAALGVVTTTNGSSIFTVTISGFSTDLTGLTAGATYYLSGVTAGGLTTSLPAAGHYHRRVLTALTSVTCIIHDNTFIEVTLSITQAERDKLENTAVLKRTFAHSGHAFVVGDPVHELGSNFIPLVKSRADSRFGSSGVGIVVEVPDANSVVVQFSGITDAITGVSNGAERYLSDVTQGAILNSPPTTVGSFIRHLYTGLEGNQIFIHDSAPIEVLSDSDTIALFLGEFADLTALQTAHATAETGSTAVLTSPNGELYFWNGTAWTNTNVLSAVLAGRELSLGNPATNGFVLSSTVAGVRSWIAPASGGGGDVTRSGTTEQYEITQFQGDTDVIEGSGIVLVDYDGGKAIPENAIEGYVAPPTNTIGITSGINLNNGINFDAYVNKIMVYTGSDRINIDLPVYGGTDGNGTISNSSNTYDVGDVFALRNSGTENINLRVSLTPGGTIQPLGTTSVSIAPGGYAALVKSSTNLQFTLQDQAGQNAPTSQSNVIATRFEQQGGTGFTQTSSSTNVVALTLVDMDLVSGETYELTWTGQVTTTDAGNEAVITINKELLNQAPAVKTSLDQKGIREALANIPGPEVMILYYTATATEQVDFTVEINSYDNSTSVTVSANALKIQRIS